MSLVYCPSTTDMTILRHLITGSLLKFTSLNYKLKNFIANQLYIIFYLILFSPSVKPSQGADNGIYVHQANGTSLLGPCKADVVMDTDKPNTYSGVCFTITSAKATTFGQVYNRLQGYYCLKLNRMYITLTQAYRVCLSTKKITLE